ncbi:MAG: hypothetical protein QOE08_297 [Thermoleophilaceae bacterium]|nr:hypothetical protein [Thermoleophilaceae bacterium]
MVRVSDGQDDTIARRLRIQAEWCGRLGSPLYESLLMRCAADVEADGPVGRVLAEPSADAWGGGGGTLGGEAIALRLMGAAHRMVLRGDAPALALFYPSVGGKPDPDGAWEAFRDLAEEHPEALGAEIPQPVQTNEVRRSAALAGGFMTLARDVGLPLRLLEVGASAGLNLRFDRYRFEAGEVAWGNPHSPVKIRAAWESGRPPVDQAVDVAERRGCDPSPVDPTTPDGRLLLLSFVWPDQLDRLTVLRGALDLAEEVAAPVDRADGESWVAAQLAEPAPRAATVVYHSVVMPYLDHEARVRFEAVVTEAGERATGAAPLAWLRMEPGGEQAELRLTTWPGGEERLLAACGFQGRPVHWLADR